MRPADRRRPALPVLVALSLAVGACGSSGDQAADDDRTETPQVVDGAGFEATELLALADDSAYVQALCSIDFFNPGDEEDPMGWVVDSLRDLPTSSTVEDDEVEWLIERIERSGELDDPLESDDLTAAAAVLRARCS